MKKLIIKRFLKNSIKILFILLIITEHTPAQNNPDIKSMSNSLSLTVSANYISSASIQLNSSSENIVERNLTTEIDGGYSAGINIKKRIFNSDLFVSLSSEYIRIKDNNLYQVLQNDTNIFKLDAKEELTLFPVELSLYYLLPDFFSNTNVYIGGGIGTYFGDRKRQLGPYVTETVSRRIHFSLNVHFSFDYFISDNLATNFEVRFRDAQYGVTSRFPVSSVTINEIIYEFPRQIESVIFIDGLRIGLGLTYTFF